jgi:hypothetical protein
MGLMGLEVFYSEHTREQTNHLINLSQHKGLLMTGGTDFHGQINDHIQMGIGQGNLNIPFSLFEKLMEAVSNSKNTINNLR